MVVGDQLRADQPGSHPAGNITADSARGRRCAGAHRPLRAEGQHYGR